MGNNSNYFFQADWVLINKLAVGPVPINKKNLESLKLLGIKSILSLCDEKETTSKINYENDFIHTRIVLPDHKYKNKLTLDKLNEALNQLIDLSEKGPVFVHCVASVERSPLLCMAFLVRKKSLNPYQALDYLMQVHKGTNPLSDQFKLLFKL